MKKFGSDIKSPLFLWSNVTHHKTYDVHAGTATLHLLFVLYVLSIRHFGPSILFRLPFIPVCKPLNSNI